MMELRETLFEIVSKDFEILKRQDDFLEALNEKLEEKKDYNTIKRILKVENILAKLYEIKNLNEEEKENTVNALKKNILANVEIMEERLDYIMDAFLYAIRAKKEEPKVQISAVKLEKKLENKETSESVHKITLEKNENDWICECGAKNSGVFCTQCGKKHGEIFANEVISNVTNFAEQEFKEIKENAQVFSEKAGEQLQKATAELSEKAKKKQENYSENSSQNLNLDNVLEETKLEQKAPENINPVTPPAPQISQTDYTKSPSYYVVDTRKSYFSFEGRMNRKAYCIMSLKLFGWYLLACFAAGLIANSSDGFAALIFAVASIIAIISSYSLTVRRFHDLNRSGWWALTLWIPYLNLLTSLFALFAPGTNGGNEYGPDPLGF